MLGNQKRKDNKQFYFVGGGIATLTGAAYLLRDCGFEGKNIHIIEALPKTGGSNDAAGDPEHGWVMRGERMINRQTYENFQDILSSIPSLEHEGNSVVDDMLQFSNTKPCCAKARFLDETGEIVDVSSYGLNKQEMMQLVNLWKTDESELDDVTITDWFGESDSHFFHTVFWYCYEASFAFQYWSSVAEFRRYTLRFFHLILRLTTAKGVTLTEHNQYESIILPLMAVMDTSYPMSATLWKNISEKKEGLGNPDKFFTHPDKSAWMTFNCTFKGHTLMDWLEKYTHNKTGEGLSSTFVESPWHMELRNPLPPFLKNQTDEYSFSWMCAFYSGNVGKYVKKTEFECTGREILEEILMSLPMDEETRQKCRDEVVAAIPVVMPYIGSQFLPRAEGDRPDVVPVNSVNLGFTGQFCEVPEDVVFTEEYSVRASRMAVYKLLGMNKQVEPVRPIKYDARIILGALISYLK